MRFYSLPAFALLASLTCGPARSEEPFSFEKTPGKLPKTVVPRHYELSLKPDAEGMAFAGAEIIDLEVLRPVSEVVLNAHNLTISQARFTDGAPLKVTLDPTNQLVTFHSEQVLQSGLHHLAVAFSGKISESASGMFAIKYTAPGGQKKMIATQFEATDARQVFPCFDEPVFRATFGLTAEVAVGITPVSNMPVAESVDSGAGMKKVRFERTPSMPVYLLVLVAGELENVRDRAGKIETRVWFTEGKRGQALYALENSKRLLRYYQEYFGVPYPLPKLDHIAMPGGFGGAMEHWGAITYNEGRILFDPKISSQDVKENSFGIMAHEMAHQWFGNLVTMAWWDNLWLNEGFASWMGSKATDDLNPSWNHWVRVDSGKSGLMALDAQKSTHPIQRAVTSESQINDAFDGITYQKGMFFIRMLEDYLGPDKFQQGLHRYMERHAFGNTTTADLWADLSAVSQQPVGAFAAGWTEQPGLPVVLAEGVCADGRQELSLRQERFTLLDPRAAPLRWKIPLTIAAAGSKNSIARMVLEESPAALQVENCSRALKLNAGSRGYYRVAYDIFLFERLRQSWSAWGEADKVNFLGDAWAMVETSRLPASGYLDLLAEVGQEKSLALWEQALGSIETIDGLLREHPARQDFRRRALAWLRPALTKAGLAPRLGETSDRGLLRARLISVAGTLGDAEVITEARRRFALYLKDATSLTGDLRPVYLSVVGESSTMDEYNELLRLARAAVLEEDRGVLLAALCAAPSPECAARTLQLSLGREFPPIQAARLVSAVSGTGRHAKLAWDFMRQHHRELIELVGGPFGNLYAGTTVAGFSDDAHAEEYVAFIKDNYPPDALAKAEEAADQIRYRAHLKKLAIPSVATWAAAGSGQKIAQ